jgi:hypothetical protein
LRSLGHRVERRAEPIGALRNVGLAFVLAPDSRLDRVDLRGLADWIKEGGTLVYGVSAFEPAAEMLREGVTLPPLGVRQVFDQEIELVGDWAPARKLVVQLTVASKTRDGADLARGGRALVFRRGQGRIYVVDAGVFSNAGLKRGDNALFLAMLAARHAGQRPIVFDEFVHGFGDAVSLLSIAPWPLRLALFTGALALVVYALATGRRRGPPSPAPEAPRRASIEQIEALAAFYAARNNRSAALQALAAWSSLPPPAPAPGEAAFAAQARALLAAGERPGNRTGT